MAWWQMNIAVSVFCVYVTNAVAYNGDGWVWGVVEEPKSIDMCVTQECIHAASWIMTNSKFSVDPCDDFYEFACGNVNLASIPDDEYMRQEFTLAEDKLLVRLKSLIEGIDKATVPKHFRLVRTLYDNCMSTVRENIDSDTKLVPQYNRLNGWPVLLGNKWNDPVFEDKSHVLLMLLSMEFYADPENSPHTVPYLAQRKTEVDSEVLRMGFNNDIVQAYYSLMVDTAVLFGARRAQAESELKEALLLGIDLAKCTPPAAKRMIITERGNRTTVGKFVKKHPKLDFRTFIVRSIRPALSDNDVIVVEGDFDEFEKVLSNASKRVLANWVKWLFLSPRLSTSAPVLHERSKGFSREKVQNEHRWKKCVTTVRSSLGLSLSALYQRKYMSQNIVSDLYGMAANLKRQLQKLVAKANWIDREAKREYRQKIDNMISQVAYRAEYVDDEKLDVFYEKVELVEGDLRNSLHNISIGTLGATGRSRGSPNARDDWVLFGNILDKNAIYHQFVNILNIGAMLTSKEFYHIDRPKYINYGALGFIMAHEMGHSLDGNGIHFDKDAKVREWWSPETKRKFDERIQCLVDQYGNYTVEELGVKLNGHRLALENTADNIGLKVAYHAYLHWARRNREEKKLPGLSYTPKQMFWISMASTWCTKWEKPGLRYSVAVGTHTPAKQRINGALADSKEFATDFKCKPGTKMNPLQKCSVL